MMYIATSLFILYPALMVGNEFCIQQFHCILQIKCMHAIQKIISRISNGESA